ncbi:hypothetical protein DPV78_007100 [Talaromyces pinophilus]|nr:hypothetical protein DPV78_007100 [Talaromyces pinophilus]
MKGQQVRREGKCGEQMAAHLYYRSPITGETSLRDRNARIGTVVYRASDGVVYQAPPCGNNNDDDFTPQYEFVLESFAGGLARKDQIQLCGAVRRL